MSYSDYPQVIEEIDEPEEVLVQKGSRAPYFFYLDSALSETSTASFSFLGAEPFLLIQTVNGVTTVSSSKKILTFYENPFEVLDRYLGLFASPRNLPFTPFWGGAVGFIGYEAAKYLPDFLKQSSFSATTQSGFIPELMFGFYDTVIVIHKPTGRKWRIQTDFSSRMERDPFFEKTATSVKLSHGHTPTGVMSISTPISNFTKKAYLSAVQKAKSYIHEGDIYQVNLSHRFSATWQEDPFALYARLKSVSPAPYSAYLYFPPYSLCSASPEQFVSIRGSRIQTRPIKGTMGRGQNLTEDLSRKESLWKSEKDTAELMMIVDLERNDLGRICEFGSVKVPELAVLETFSHVFHLVGTITGQLRKNISHVNALQKLFPGGSITGAPKLRAMQIIHELETVPRGPYTGCIGYFGFNNSSQFNIAIRTLYAINGELHYHTGGGIVADSDPEMEWKETLLKAKNFFETLT